MIDISFERGDATKAHVYLDGLDARVFRALRAKLGSDEAVQNALILVGAAHQMGTTGGPNSKRVQEIQASFREFVGVSYQEFQALLSQI